MRTPDRTLHITKLAFVESLRELDGHTAECLARVVGAELVAAGAGPVLEVFRCSGSAGFREIVARLVDEAERGEHTPCCILNVMATKRRASNLQTAAWSVGKT